MMTIQRARVPAILRVPKSVPNEPTMTIRKAVKAMEPHQSFEASDGEWPEKSPFKAQGQCIR
jgi:hypothetical protein